MGARQPPVPLWQAAGAPRPGLGVQQGLRQDQEHRGGGRRHLHLHGSVFILRDNRAVNEPLQSFKVPGEGPY